jgi:hypothetical protein
MTAAVPQIPKIVTFSLAAQDFSEDVIDCAIVPTPGAIKKVVTLDGVVHQDTEPESWGLKVTAVLDWDSGRPGLAYYAYTHKGESVAFIYNAYGVGAESASAPKMTGICKLVAMPYGGPGNDFSTVDVTFPITGVPTRDATP